MSNLENLKNYKYNCIDKSLLAKFILNPLHTKLTTYFPLTIAPNTITLLGLFCSLLSVALTIFTDPHLNDQKYPVVKLINAFLLFAYQAFDAIDGKQARRLGMSTPLGQLFDHGCDAFVCFATSITLTSSFGLGAGINLYYITICMTAVYALCSFEEYFTDIFYLGYINGPSEGIFIGVVSHIVSYFIGHKIGIMLTQEYKTMSWLMIFCIVFTVTSFVNSFIYIIRNRKRNDKAEVWNAFMCLYTLLISAFIYQFHKNAKSSFYITYLTFMFVFARLTLEISYAHLKLEKIDAFDSFFYIYVVGALFGMIYEVKMVVYGMMLLIMVVNYVEFAFVTIKEVCRNLGISCFKVKDTKKEE